MDLAKVHPFASAVYQRECPSLDVEEDSLMPRVDF